MKKTTAATTNITDFSALHKHSMAESGWKWMQPTAPATGGKLMVNNSLVRGTNLVQFVPQTPGVVTWYSCGPTVYDSSHMGHARTYLSIDVLQRILEEYFGYSVFSVMNVTDIDDKIILKGKLPLSFFLNPPSRFINQLTHHRHLSLFDGGKHNK